MDALEKKYWRERYQQQKTDWDAGTITTPLKEYFDQLKNHQLEILIPGAGNSYEAEYLHKKGFQAVSVLDIAEEPLSEFQKRVLDFPHKNIICADFFSHQHCYDLIVEQTFFCAIDPKRRKEYVKAAFSMLKSGGLLVGLLFEQTFSNDGPPFGGSRDEYLAYFEPFFEVKKMELCYNSIKPRQGRELFIILQRTVKEEAKNL